MLHVAGLGEKRITLLMDSGSYEIHEELQSQFPQLRNCGGFELCRLADGGGGRGLYAIPSPKNGYTVAYLRAVLHHAKVFIRPLQKDITVDEENTSLEEVSIIILDTFQFSHLLSVHLV